MRLLLSTLAILTLTACTLTEQREQPGQNVILTQAEPTNCKNIGTFFGSGNKPEKALIGLLNAIGEHGGDHAYVISNENIQNDDPVAKSIPLLGDVLNEDHVTYGLGFKCAT